MLINDIKNLFGEPVKLEKRSFQPGETVFSRGDPANNIFAVEKGRIKLERYTIEGRQIVIQVANEGDSFAEAALFSDIYHCNAVAAKQSQVVFFPKDRILEILRRYPEKALQYIDLLSSQVCELRSRFELRNILSARERIMQHFFLSITDDTNELTIQGTLRDLALELGLSHETFYRELARLEKDKLLKRIDKKIIIL